MNIMYTPEAVAAYNAANSETRKAADALLGSYAAYANRHALPGKSTLKNISRDAREVLGLPAGTRVFARGAEG